MKKSTKIWCITAGIMIAVGLCLGIIGTCMGGLNVTTRWFTNGELSIGPFGYHLTFGSSEIRLNEDYPVESGSVERTEIETARAVKKIDVHAGGTTVTVRDSGNAGYGYESANAGDYQCYADGDTLYLRARDNYGYDTTKREIILYIPFDEEYEYVEIDVGGGVIKTEAALRSDVTKIHVGAGKLKMQGINGGELQLDIAAGAAELYDVHVQNAEMEVSMGQVNLEGNIERELLADCAMGNMEFRIDSAWEDHNYEVDCAMGNIRIGSHSYAGMGMEQTINNQTDSDYSLSCSMGEIKMQFR